MQNSSNSGNSVDLKAQGDQTSGSRRRRAPNFTDKEIRILVKLVFAHIEMIESKQTDSETWRVKDIVWNNITENFNNSSGTSKRTVEMIRQKYDSIKKIARKKDARNREGDSKEEPDFVDMEDYEKELIRLLESVGGNTGQAHEPATVLLPETKFTSGSIKTENNAMSHASNADLNDFKDDEKFIITDEDMLWDLPNDTVNRPRLLLIKKQLEQLEREEQRHKYRMKTEEIKRKYVLSQEKRARLEHKKKMELLHLEIQLKQKAMADSLSNGANS